LRCVAEYLEMIDEFGDGNINFSPTSGYSELAGCCASP
jgi:hypothetical protein